MSEQEEKQNDGEHVIAGDSQGQSLTAIWNDLSVSERVPTAAVFRAHCWNAWRSVRAAPFTAALTLSVSVTVLLVLVSFVATVESIRGALQGEGGGLALSLFLRDEADDGAIEALQKQISTHSEVASVHLQTSEQALGELRVLLGQDRGVLAGLDGKSPLPRSLEITFHPREQMETVFADFSATYGSNPSVDYVLYNRGVLGQLGLALASLRIFSVVASVILLVLASFIISSAIRLGLYAHREEIEIMRLVGATDRFIEAPYVIEGAFQGFLAAVFSLFGVSVLGRAARQAFGADPILGTFVMGFQSLSFGWSMCLLLASIIIAGFGSFLAVRGFNLVRD